MYLSRQNRAQRMHRHQRVTPAIGTTQDRLVRLLRRAPASVDELASTLGLTANAVRQHLVALERDGIVLRAGPRRLGTVGKPATLYEIAPEAEVAFSRAHAPVLSALVAALPSHLPRARLSKLLAEVGTRLAAGIPTARGTLVERAHAGAAHLASLGSLTEVTEHGHGTAVISGCACPLGDAVRARPELCRTIEEMLATITRAKVQGRCDRTGTPRCAFLLSERRKR